MMPPGIQFTPEFSLTFLRLPSSVSNYPENYYALADDPYLLIEIERKISRNAKRTAVEINKFAYEGN